MKINLNKTALIDLDWLDKEIESIKQRKACADTENKITMCHGMLEAFEKVKKSITPALPLAERCFDAGSLVKSENLITIDDFDFISFEADKQQFLNSEIEL